MGHSFTFFSRRFPGSGLWLPCCLQWPRSSLTPHSWS